MNILIFFYIIILYIYNRRIVGYNISQNNIKDISTLTNLKHLYFFFILINIIFNLNSIIISNYLNINKITNYNLKKLYREFFQCGYDKNLNYNEFKSFENLEYL